MPLLLTTTMIPIQTNVNRQLLQLIEHMSVKSTITIALLAMFLGFCGLVLCESIRNWIRIKYPDDTKKQNRAKLLLIGTCISFCITIFGGLYAVASKQTISIAKQHGCHQLDMTWQEMLQGIAQSPIEDTLPKNQENLQNSLILYYKFGCDDCEAIYKDLQEQTKHLSNVYWVATRSKQGIRLRDTYPVTEVPAGVYITSRNTGVTKNLVQTVNQKVVIHQTNLDFLLSMLEESK